MRRCRTYFAFMLVCVFANVLIFNFIYFGRKFILSHISNLPTILDVGFVQWIFYLIKTFICNMCIS